MTGGQLGMFDSPLARARALKVRHRFREALQLLRQALADNPGDLKAKASLADLFYRTRRHREAMALAGEILRDDPDDPQALVVMGNVLLSRKQPREALWYLKLALEVAETEYLLVRVARGHLDLRQPREALEALDRAEAIQPGGRELLRLRAEAARALKNASLEREALQRAAKTAPADQEEFSAFVLPLLRDLPPRKATLASENMRQQPGQELNPFLLLFESQSLLKSRDPKGALARLEFLLKQGPPETLRRESERLSAKIQSKANRSNP